MITGRGPLARELINMKKQSRIEMVIVPLLLLSAYIAIPYSALAVDDAKPRPNVLMICIDDLNDWVGCLKGHPAGIGWSTGRACVINCECELGRVAPGDVLVTKVPGPALSQVLPRVAGVVAELGGSTSHLASLARERGIPMVLGVLDATQKIPDGGQVAVDGVAGVVRWIR